MGDPGHGALMITVSTTKSKVRNHMANTWEDKYEGRRTFVSDYGVYALRSGPVFSTEQEAQQWATTVRTDEEVRRSSQELIASPTVQSKPKPTRRARK